MLDMIACNHSKPSWHGAIAILIQPVLHTRARHFFCDTVLVRLIPDLSCQGLSDGRLASPQLARFIRTVSMKFCLAFILQKTSIKMETRDDRFCLRYPHSAHSMI